MNNREGRAWSSSEASDFCLEIFALVWRYTAYICRQLQTFRANLSIQSSREKQSWFKD